MKHQPKLMKKTQKTNYAIPTLASAAGLALFTLMACSEQKKADITTLETVKAEAAVNAFDTTGSNELKLKAETAFADLDREIRELEVRVETTVGEKKAEALYKLTELKKRSSEIRGDFNEAKVRTLIEDVKQSVR
jgi:hypothetical protein